MFDYYDDDPYDLILESSDPKNITNVSMLRHYINVHGVTKYLLEYSHLTESQLSQIADVVAGNVRFKQIINNFETVLQEAIEKKKKQNEAIRKNKDLVKQLRTSRENFCGIGTRRIKLLLNKLAKNGDIVAKAYRLVLEIEDKNITAKDTDFRYMDKVYAQKHMLIVELIEFCIENSFKYGVQNSLEHKTNAIVYFELPGMEQISFHTTFYNGHNYQEYDGEWDGKVNSTLAKIETSILERYGDEVNKLKE